MLRVQPAAGAIGGGFLIAAMFSAQALATQIGLGVSSPTTGIKINSALSTAATINVAPNCFQPAAVARAASGTFRAVAPQTTPKASASPSAAAETTTVTISGDNFNPFSPVLITFDAGPGGKPQSFEAQTDQSGHLHRDIQVTEPPDGLHVIRADDLARREANDTNYKVPCFQPSVTLDPPIGPPGFVTTAVGSGFPANRSIAVLNWLAPGLLSPLPKNLATDASGSFRLPILILHHDVLGPRWLQAIVANPFGDRAGAPIETDAPFLVTRGRSQPPYDSIDSRHWAQVMPPATMPMAKLDPDRMNFSQNVGATSKTQIATLTNQGDGLLTIGGIAASGDFKAMTHCPSALLPGQSCTIGISFTPQARGSRNGSLMVTDDANATPGSTQTVGLSGVGHQPVARLSAAALSPAANLGESAGTQTVTVTNTGDGPLSIDAIRINGVAAGDYTQSNNCLRKVQPGGSCVITVNFTPRDYGTRVATLTLSDDGLGRTQSIALRGTGTAGHPLLSSGFLNFGGDTIGKAAVPQNVVLLNAGNGPLSIASVSLTGADYSMTTTCSSTLAAGASCTISVTFTPQAAGARSGLITITDAGGTQRVSLSGVGT